MKRTPSQTLTDIISSINEEDFHPTTQRMRVASTISDYLQQRNISPATFAKMMNRSESEISELLAGNTKFTVINGITL